MQNESHPVCVCMGVCFGVNLSVRHYVVCLIRMFTGAQQAAFDSCVSMTAVCAHAPAQGPQCRCVLPLLLHWETASQLLCSCCLH